MDRIEDDSSLTAEQLKARILELVERYARVAHRRLEFDPVRPRVPVSGKVYGAEELRSVVDAGLEFWLTTGRFNAAFESGLAGFLGVKHALTTNSGSSANLLAVAALTSPLLADRALKAGDEIITVAAGFPTTVNPALLYGLRPVFVDIDIPTYNVSIPSLKEAITPRTRAVMLAHTLGNPFNLAAVMELCAKHGLWLVEDACDALGSTYTGNDGASRFVGSYGDISTASFYPAHHITTGEGGAVFTNNGRLKPILESIRDWGRDCFCETGKDNTCGKRFGWTLGDLPHGYDHKYIYSHLGYNLKMTDLQAAIGVAQLQRLPAFAAARRRNFIRLRDRLRRLEDLVVLPEATAGSDPSWFGFPLMLRDGAPPRLQVVAALESRGVATRLLFGGNLTKQPYFKGLDFRTVGELPNTDAVMRRAFWVGVYPGLSEEMIDHISNSLYDALGRG